MHPQQDFFDILQTVTVDCKDNGECFTVTDRVAAVERVIERTNYKLISRQPLALLYAKHPVCEGDRVLLISSHIDCVYSRCFSADEGDCLRGTFDNSFTNAALLWNMVHDCLPDNVVVAFTGNEESDSQGAVQTVVALGQMGCEVPPRESLFSFIGPPLHKSFAKYYAMDEATAAEAVHQFRIYYNQMGGILENEVYPGVRELLSDLKMTKTELNDAYTNFENVVDPDLVDSWIYQVNAVQKRYHFLLKQAQLLDLQNSIEEELTMLTT